MFRSFIQDAVSYLSEVDLFIQSCGLFLLSMIPFIESPGGSIVGSLIGYPIVGAIVLSLFGNWLSLLVVVLSMTYFRNRRKSHAKQQRGFFHQRAIKARERYEKYGVPSVALIAPIIFSAHVAAFASLTAGASKQQVLVWHTISIILWGIFGAIFGTYLQYDIIH